MDAVPKSFVAECFWPDVHEHDVRELDSMSGFAFAPPIATTPASSARS